MITVVGSLNMDLVTNVIKTPNVGETTIGEGLYKICGGKGANQASAMARLNGNVAMIGKIGEDEFGNILKESLKNDGVDISDIKMSEEPTGVAMIMVNENGDNSIVVIPGANFDIKKEDIDDALETIKNSNILIAQLETPLDIVEYALKSAKKYNKYTILNPAPARKLNKEIIENIDLLTPNETELQLLSGININCDEDILKAGKILINQGVKELVITLGDRGALYMNENNHKHFNGYKVKAVDTTAAGDSVNGALAVCLDEGKNIDEAIRFAMKVGALTVMEKGAQSSLPTFKKSNGFSNYILGGNQMKKGKLIHSEISHLISKLGHTDGITIGDCGLPIPDDVKRIDLAITLGVPSFLTVLETVISEQWVEEIVLAEEIEEVSKEMYVEIIKRIKVLEIEQGNNIKINMISHEEFKSETKNTKAVIRTGESTPYTNIILKSGVVF